MVTVIEAHGELWQRMRGENEKVFSYFVIYRDLGANRTVPKVCDELIRREEVQRANNIEPTRKGSRRTLFSSLRKYSMKYNWPERARAWDNEQDRLKTDAQLEECKKMAERQAKAGQLMQVRASTRLARMTDTEINQLTPREVVDLMNAGARLERMARGEPETITKTEVGGSVATSHTETNINVQRQELVITVRDLFKRIGLEGVLAWEEKLIEEQKAAESSPQATVPIGQSQGAP